MVVSVCSGHLSGMVFGDPESGTDHSLKEVSGCFIWHKVHTQECTEAFCAV